MLNIYEFLLTAKGDHKDDFEIVSRAVKLQECKHVKGKEEENQDNGQGHRETRCRETCGRNQTTIMVKARINGECQPKDFPTRLLQNVRSVSGFKGFCPYIIFNLSESQLSTECSALPGLCRQSSP